MNIKDYCQHLRNSGLKAVVGSENTAWISHERFSMLRQPTAAMHMPSKAEIKEVFSLSHAAVLSFVVRPCEKLVANSWHYVCTDPDYSLDKLGRGARYDTRRGLSEFEIGFLEQSEIVRLGEQAYSDTLARNGISVDHRERFEVGFGRTRHDRRYLAAMKGNQLAAFLLVTEVNDWVSIGGYSADKFLPLRPNNGLIYYVIHRYLVEKKFRVVDYGLSSIQGDTHAEGLTRFKLKMGFESVPVHRAFIVNPLFRPLVNRVSWRVANGMLKLFPPHPLLKKAEGALRTILPEHQ